MAPNVIYAQIKSQAGWLSAWNVYDLEAILSHYAEDFEMVSSYIAAITSESSGVLKGNKAICALQAASPLSETAPEPFSI